MPALIGALTALARAAKQADIGLTVDAEEADRLEISLDIFAAVLADPRLARLGRTGSRRAGLSEARAAADRLDRRSLARRTRPPHSGAAGEGRLLGHRDQARAGAGARGLSGVHPQGRDRRDLDRLRAAHAGTPRRDLSGIRHAQRAQPGGHSGKRRRREFRDAAPARHGRGAVSRLRTPVRCASMRRSATHEDLLAYLVRRLLENGANTSFVHRLVDPSVPEDAIIADPVAAAARRSVVTPQSAHSAAARRCIRIASIPPASISPIVPTRRSCSLPSASSDPRCQRPAPRQAGRAKSAIRPIAASGRQRSTTPAPRDRRGTGRARRVAGATGTRRAVTHRAEVLERAADLIEAARDELLFLLAREARQDTWPMASPKFARPPTSAAGMRCVRGATSPRRANCRDRPASATPGRSAGAACSPAISPWNFPLAIFTGQIAAALAAGNAVAAKPAEQTPLIAARAVALLHRGRRAARRAGAAAGRRHGRPGAGERSAHRRRRLHRRHRDRAVASRSRSPRGPGRSFRSSPRPAASTR